MKVRIIGSRQIVYNWIIASIVIIFIVLFDFEGAKLNLMLNTKGFALVALYFAAMLVLLLSLAFSIKFVKRLKQKRTAADFLHVLAVALFTIAVPEELIFRGLFQGFLELILQNKWFALAIATLYFGAAHLWTPKPYNWRYAFLAAIAGFFFGLTFMQTENIFYPILLHGLVIATWYTFFFKGFEGKA